MAESNRDQCEGEKKSWVAPSIVAATYNSRSAKRKATKGGTISVTHLRRARCLRSSARLAPASGASSFDVDCSAESHGASSGAAELTSGEVVSAITGAVGRASPDSSLPNPRRSRTSEPAAARTDHGSPGPDRVLRGHRTHTIRFFVNSDANPTARTADVPTSATCTPRGRHVHSATQGTRRASNRYLLRLGPATSGTTHTTTV